MIKREKFSPLILLLCVVFLSVLLTGCNGQSEPQPSSEDPQPISKATDYENIKNVGMNVQFTSQMDAAKTEEGMYYVEDWPISVYEGKSPWNHRGNIVYLDYDSHQKMYLCNIPGCAHNSQNCQSYVEFSRSVCLFTNADGTVLFLMSEGAKNGEIYDEEDVGRLISMNPDGTNRKEVLRLESTQSFNQDPVFANNDIVIFSIQDFNKNTKSYSTKILQLEIVSGTIETLYEHKGMCSLRDILPNGDMIISVYDGHMQVNSPVNMEMIRIRPDGSSESVYTSGKTMPLVVEGDIIVTETKGETVNISIENLLTEEYSTVTIDNIPNRLPALVFGVTDEKAHLRYYTLNGEESEAHELFVGLKDGSVTEKTLHYDSEYGSDYVTIVARYKKSYLVKVGREKVSKTYTGDDGIPITVEGIDSVYATISIEDYWNNIPEYVLFRIA